MHTCTINTPRCSSHSDGLLVKAADFSEIKVTNSAIIFARQWQEDDSIGLTEENSLAEVSI